jgi:hypothetical protein
MNDELSAEAKRLSLQDEIDQFYGFTSLTFGFAMRDLVGLELQ